MRQFDQLVSLMPPRTYDDHNVVPPSFCLDSTARGVTNLLGVCNAGSTKLLHDYRHDKLSLFDSIFPATEAGCVRPRLQQPRHLKHHRR
jgi:hypothetical protein